MSTTCRNSHREQHAVRRATRRSSRSYTSTTSPIRTASAASGATYFDELRDGAADVAHAPVVESFIELARNRKVAHAMVDAATMHKQVLVLRMISKFRMLGHVPRRPRPAEAARKSRTSPTSTSRTTALPRATSTPSSTSARSRPAPTRMRLRDIIDALQDTYCRTFGAEYMYIADTATKRCVQERLEPIRATADVRRRAAAAHPRAPDRSGDARALPAHEVRRPEALLRRRRGDDDPDARPPDPARRRAGRKGDGDRHGASRAAQRAGQHAGQDAGGPLLRVRGQARRRSSPPAT